MYLFIEYVLYNILVMVQLDPSLIPVKISSSTQANQIITDYVNNIFTTDKIVSDVFDIANNSTINKQINTLKYLINLNKDNSSAINTQINKLNTIVNNIQESIKQYTNNINLLDNYFDETSGSIGRYNDSLQIYNFKLLENILYIIGIIILVYKMIGWNININL